MNTNDNNTLKVLKKERKPILIYGNMNTATVIYKTLASNSIHPKAFVVDKFAYKKKQHFNGLEVLCFDDIKNLESYNIVIGFDNVEKTQALLSLKKYLKFSVFHLISVGSLFNWSPSFIKRNLSKFQNLRNLFADEKSKKILDALISAKQGNVSGINNLLSLSDSRQYFNELTFEQDFRKEIFVDCGAFDGDSIQKFIAFAENKYKKIIAFEPLDENYNELRQNTKNIHSLKVIKKGTWNMETELSFSANSSASSVSNEGSVKIKTTTVDKIVKNQRVTFIKMDVEGSEYESLLGAQKTIERNQPKLAICVYHKFDDLFRLPKLIQSFNVNYKYYLRHHSNRLSETVLYCFPIKKT